MKMISKFLLLLFCTTIFMLLLTSSASIAAKKSKDVKVTVSDMLNSDNIAAYLKKVKFKKVVKNDDYTSTYTMTKAQQKNVLKFLQKEINSMLKDELSDGYYSITANDNFTSFKAIVDKNKYKKNIKNDDTPLGLMIFSGGYQQFGGVKNLEFSVEIVDKKSKKVINKYTLEDLM